MADISVAQELNSHWWCTVNLRQTEDRRFPAEDMLGQNLQIVTSAEDGAENILFDGVVVESELEYELYGSYAARLNAVTRSHLLDNGPRRQYFRESTPKQIIEKIIESAGLAMAGSLPDGPQADYHQCEESDWDFIRRLADDLQTWLRPTSDGIEFRTAFDAAVDLPWRQEHGLIGFRVTGRLSQPSANGAHYDPAQMQSRTYENVARPPTFLGSSGPMVSAVQRASKDFLPPGYVNNRSRSATLNDFQARLERESQRSIGHAITCSGECGEARVQAGTQVNIQGPLDGAGTYGVTRVSHTWTSNGYSNTFDCTPWAAYSAPVQPSPKLAPGLIPARIVDNNDPDNHGRVRIQFYWQESNETSWAPMMALHAGADRGFLFLPEVGDEVWVAFEEGDPERPLVLGSAWNGVHKPPREEFWGGDVGPNDVKRIVTKSGHRISIVDKDGQSSIVLATPNHVRVSLIENSNETGDSVLSLHSDGDIILSAPNGRIHCQSKLFSKEIG